MPMQPSSVFMLYLAVFVLLAMVVFYRCLREQKLKELRVTDTFFALKEGQTILGVEETSQGVAFYVGSSVRDDWYYDFY